MFLLCRSAVCGRACAADGATNPLQSMRVEGSGAGGWPTRPGPPAGLVCRGWPAW